MRALVHHLQPTLETTELTIGSHGFPNTIHPRRCLNSEDERVASGRTNWLGVLSGHPHLPLDPNLDVQQERCHALLPVPWSGRRERDDRTQPVSVWLTVEAGGGGRMGGIIDRGPMGDGVTLELDEQQPTLAVFWNDAPGVKLKAASAWPAR